MSTFDSTKLPLKDLLKDIVEGKIQLPDFQRGWVWDDEHVRSLLVSLGRSFPVGAVMLLETGGEVRFEVRPVENVPSSGLPSPEKLILDGQQRLTTLTQVLKLQGPVKTTTGKENLSIAITIFIFPLLLRERTGWMTQLLRLMVLVKYAVILAEKLISIFLPENSNASSFISHARNPRSYGVVTRSLHPQCQCCTTFL